MNKNIYILATNPHIGLIVDEIYRIELADLGWAIQLIPDCKTQQFNPEDQSYVVIDRRLSSYLTEH